MPLLPPAFEDDKASGSRARRGKTTAKSNATTSSTAASGEVKTGLDDLTLFCANCHRMIHRQNPGRSPSGLTVDDAVPKLAHDVADLIRRHPTPRRPGLPTQGWCRADSR